MNSGKPYSLHTRNNAHLTITHTMKNCTPTRTNAHTPVNRTHASERVHNLYTELASIQKFIRRFLKNIANKQKRKEFLYNVKRGDIFRKNNSKKEKREIVEDFHKSLWIGVDVEIFKNKIY